MREGNQESLRNELLNSRCVSMPFKEEPTRVEVFCLDCTTAWKIHNLYFID